MSWIGNLFGTEKAVNNILDKDNGLIAKAGAAIGNFHYSEQEKANSSREVQEWSIRYLDALAPFKIVQRVLAFAAMGLWVFFGINLAVAVWIKALYPEIDALTGLKAIALSDYIFWPVVSIFVLYTGGGTINSLKGGT